MAEDLATRSARQLLERLKLTAGPYAEYALAARKRYVDLRLRQDREIRSLYLRAADQVAREIRRIATRTGVTAMELRFLVQLEQTLRDGARRLTEGLTAHMTRYVKEAVEAGAGYAMDITSDLLEKGGLSPSLMLPVYMRVNTQAVEAIWARTQKGLKLSDRIWQKGEKAREVMRDIIQDAVAMGEDPVKTARKLEQYVRQGKGTLASQYPEMMKRMGSRIPMDLSYEALRLARTETAAAYGEGTIAASRVSPSYQGMKWLISNSHPVRDICDDLAETDHGMGPGVYPPGMEPRMPAHPNCLCILVPKLENPEDFTDLLIEWVNDPSSHPDLEEWYTEKAGGLMGGTVKPGTPRAAAKPPVPPEIAEIDRIVKNAPIHDLRKLGDHLLSEAGVTGVKTAIRRIDDARGYNAIRYTPHGSLDKAEVVEYVLQSNDGRPRWYRVKTAFHEGVHARLHGALSDKDLIGFKRWLSVEETVAETVAHYMTRQAGITQEIAPSYAKYLVNNLPRLKLRPEFADCVTVADFGRVLSRYRFAQRTGQWKELADYLDQTSFDLWTYAEKYRSYVLSHLDEITDVIYENVGIDDVNIKNDIKRDILNGWRQRRETLGFMESLIIAMNRMGVK